ncbi:MAG: hypothetical protein EHM85_19410 [Desulfobacteraceae bacterium]|nr:MAG: hypothetical protein EHM85_19410 [Desulfobacteraceae bacterium]
MKKEQVWVNGLGRLNPPFKRNANRRARLTSSLFGQTSSIIVWTGIAKLETFTEPKELAENPYYQVQRQKSLGDLTDDMIDMPIIDLINGFNKLPYCFTLQSCYGHFVYNDQKDSHTLEPLPVKDTIPKVEYRIAYIAFCIENSLLGRELYETLKKMTAVDPENIQFCCAEWFWKIQINSYALQVEPDRFKLKDTAILDYKEALHIEKIRNEFFFRLYELVENAGKR